MTNVLLAFISGLLILLCAETDKPVTVNSLGEWLSFVGITYLMLVVAAAVLGAIVYIVASYVAPLIGLS